MTVEEAYVKLRLPKNLQEHHLRVTALIQLIIENWQGKPLDQPALLLAGLFHDAANILKFKFDNPAMMGEDEAARIDYWRQVQEEVKAKYGTNIHHATVKMCQELNLLPAALSIIEHLEWDEVNEALKEENWLVAIAIYADMRISPYGIISLKERIDNLHSRIPLRDYDAVLASAFTLEQAIQAQTQIDLSKISSAQLSSRFQPLLKLSL